MDRSQEDLLQTYYSKLDEANRLIVLGKVAELYKEQMMRMQVLIAHSPFEDSAIEGYSSSKEEIREAMKKMSSVDNAFPNINT